MCNNNIFIKKKWVIGLVSKIDAIDGKKRVKFVAMQQNSETLINDLKHIERYSGELPQKHRTAIWNITVPSLCDKVTLVHL